MNPLSRLQSALAETLPMASLEVQPLPGCTEINLALINSDFPTGPLPAEVMHAVIARPAYWAFCWGSGLGLARTLLDQPAWVRGKTVLDLGSGSGVAGIAAAMAGASHVVACDIDPHACLSTTANAAINDTALEVVTDLNAASLSRYDIILMADVLYDRSNFALLELARGWSDHLLVADSRIRKIDESGFTAVGELQALTFPNLGEFDEFRTVRLFERLSDQ